MTIQSARKRRGGEDQVEHLLRRAGFGASQEEIDGYLDLGFSGTLDYLLRYDRVPDDVDSFIGKPGYIGTSVVGAFMPSQNITHARQRWLFRMVHTRRPLQEKMTLFWHNHFATAASKVLGTLGGMSGARYMAALPAEDPHQIRGQLETLRGMALGNFKDIVVAMAKDVAMVTWLDGRFNVRGRPQENFARELMELFTMGVGHYTEEDVYAAARVFTGWNLAYPGQAYYAFSYIPNSHDTAAKDFTFQIYPTGSKTIPARAADAGLQDGLDLIDAVVRHPATGPRLALKLYRYFISEIDTPDTGLINELSKLYYQHNFEMKPVVAHLLRSPQFAAGSARYARYSWPVEFVVRAIKEVGWNGFSISDANVLSPLISMGQQLYEPPDVNGWDLGSNWFSSGGTLARMNFAATLATNQKFNLRDVARGQSPTPEALLSLMSDRLTPKPFANDAYRALLDYVRAGGAWTGSDTQVATKAAGLAHLIVGSGDYQLV
ncbi:MAG TPA: DUF1800 domain-containing protein [Vicinamibacterales bacterium]|nr:DUF1800 domain-containing protein [Vicinamibacterales bacterium]